MTHDLVAQGVLLREAYETIEYGVADPSIFVRDGGPSIAENMAVLGCMWNRADNKRIPGWTEFRRRLGSAEAPAMVFVLSNCPDFIRTIPTLQHDETNAEDIDTEGEDHVADEARYAFMSRPWIVDEDVPEAVHFPKTPQQMTIFEHIARGRQQRLALEYHDSLG